MATETQDYLVEGSCYMCKESFETTHEAIIHLKQHFDSDKNEKQWLLCDFHECEQECKSQSTFLKHLSGHYVGLELFHCKMCKFKTGKKEGMKHHLKQCLKNKDKPKGMNNNAKRKVLNIPKCDTSISQNYSIGVASNYRHLLKFPNIEKSWNNSNINNNKTNNNHNTSLDSVGNDSMEMKDNSCDSINMNTTVNERNKDRFVSCGSDGDSVIVDVDAPFFAMTPNMYMQPSKYSGATSPVPPLPPLFPENKENEENEENDHGDVDKSDDEVDSNVNIDIDHDDSNVQSFVLNIVNKVLSDKSIMENIKNIKSVNNGHGGVNVVINPIIKINNINNYNTTNSYNKSTDTNQTVNKCNNEYRTNTNTHNIKGQSQATIASTVSKKQYI